MSKGFSAKLEDLQRRLYQDACRELNNIDTLQSPTIAEYEKSFESSLPKTVIKTSRRALLNSIVSSKLCLIGDFHTLRQSQREALRILRECLSHENGKTLYFAMECFHSSDQAHIDSYLEGTIEIEELFRKTRFDHDWGFPTQNYQMLIEFCRHHGIRIKGINTDNGGRDPIKKRDEHCADILLKILSQESNAKIVVLIGEYHLADDKLPAAILQKSAIKPEKMVRVLTNTDRYFESVGGAFSNFDSVYLRLDRNFYSILNTSPWLKWMSVLHWEETSQSSYSNDYVEEDSDEDYNVFDFDVDHFFLHITKQTATVLGVELGDALLSHFRIVNLSEVNDFQTFARENSISPKAAKQLRLFSEIFGAFVNDDSRTIFLKNYSFSSLASAVGQFLTMASQESHTIDPARRELSLLVGQISSKVLNPKIKLKTIRDIGFRRFRTFTKLLLNPDQTQVSRAVDAVALSEVVDGVADLLIEHAVRTQSGEKLLREFIASINRPSFALNRLVRAILDQRGSTRSRSGAGTKKAS